MFQPDTFVDQVVEQSKLYAGQNDMQKAAAAVNSDIYRYSIIFKYFHTK